MNHRQRREFEAGLAEEVDVWLRGDATRRIFLTRLVELGGLAAMSGSIWAATSGLALAAAELADPSTPLGQAQALAVKASTEGPADGSAYRAVQAAKQYGGVTLNMTYESGLQALDPRNFSGPLWEQLTGIKSNVVELSSAIQGSSDR
jgi:multiple sugar transport system substrate-binding protein